MRAAGHLSPERLHPRSRCRPDVEAGGRARVRLKGAGGRGRCHRPPRQPSFFLPFFLARADRKDHLLLQPPAQQPSSIDKAPPLLTPPSQSQLELAGGPFHPDWSALARRDAAVGHPQLPPGSATMPESSPPAATRSPSAGSASRTSNKSGPDSRIRYPFWFGGSASSMAACVTHPLDLGMLAIPSSFSLSSASSPVPMARGRLLADASLALQSQGMGSSIPSPIPPQQGVQIQARCRPELGPPSLPLPCPADNPSLGPTADAPGRCAQDDQRHRGQDRPE